MKEVTLSRKNQIVIPREARAALSLEPGDKLLCIPRGNIVIILAKPEKYSKALHGIAKNLYKNEYLQQERGSWR